MSTNNILIKNDLKIGESEFLKYQNWKFSRSKIKKIDFLHNRQFFNFRPINWDNRRNHNTEMEKGTLKRNLVIWDIPKRFILTVWLPILDKNWPIITKRFWPRYIKNSQWSTNLDPNQSKPSISDKFGPKSTKTDRD